MKLLIALIAALSLFGGGFTLLAAKSAVHEILGVALIICFVVATVGLAILGALEDILKALGGAKKPTLKAPEKTVITATGRRTIP